MLLNKFESRRGESGFTLVELLITMLIVTVGLLGLAKLQATAVANSSVARTRALMTYQAESLAGMMRANKQFWVTTGAPAVWPGFNAPATVAPSDSGMLAPTPETCVGTTITSVCSPQNLAYDDMYRWAFAFNGPTNPLAAFPGASAKIACVPAPPASPTTACTNNPAVPNGYDITLSWTQKLVAINRSSVNSTPQTLSMVMHVQP